RPRRSVDPHLAANHVRAGRKMVAPIFIAQDCHLIRVIVHLRFGELASQRWTRAERREELRCYSCYLLYEGRSGFTHNGGPESIHGYRAKRRNLALPLVIVGNRRSIPFYAGLRIGVENRQ